MLQFPQNILKPVQEKNCARPIEAEARAVAAVHSTGVAAWLPLRSVRPTATHTPTRRPGSAQSRSDILGGESALPTLPPLARRPLVRFPEIR